MNRAVGHHGPTGFGVTIRTARGYPKTSPMVLTLAWMTVNLFVCEAYGTPCATDDSDDDGHRANIIRDRSYERGCGYAMGTSPYWTQDFGGGIPEGPRPVVAASHAFVDDGLTSFFLNYHDSAGGPPLSMQVIIDDIPHGYRASPDWDLSYGRR